MLNINLLNNTNYTIHTNFTRKRGFQSRMKYSAFLSSITPSYYTLGNKDAKLTALLDTGQKKIKQRNEKKKPTKKKSKERKKRRLTI